MKVYCFKPNSGGYCGGCIIVAANSPLEALGVIHNKHCSCAEYADIEHCTEIDSLTANAEEPTVIVSAFYIE